jgi:acetoin utilization deacetylase AcuC-like enzyme
MALEVARTHAEGRLVSCLEGGYNVDALAESVQAHLEVLLAKH